MTGLRGGGADFDAGLFLQIGSIAFVLKTIHKIEAGVTLSELLSQLTTARHRSAAENVNRQLHQLEMQLQNTRFVRLCPGLGRGYLSYTGWTGIHQA